MGVRGLTVYVHDCGSCWKIVPYWVYLGQGEDFKLTRELSEKVQSSALNQGIEFDLNGALENSPKKARAQIG